MRRRLALSAFVLFALVGAACGDDDEGGSGGDGGGGGEGLSSEEQDLADAWATSLSDDEDSGGGFTFPEDDAKCMGDAIMAELGMGPFEKAEVDADDIIGEGDEDESPGELLGAGVISDEQADAILDEWEGCTDLNAAFIDVVAADAELDDDGRTCLEEGLEEEGLVREGFRASFTQDDSDPPEEVITAIVSLMSTCGGDGAGTGGIIVDSIAESLAADGRLTEEQSRCMAQEMVDAIGMERIVELGVGGGEFEEADPAVQQEMAGAVLGAAEACDVPLASLGG